MGGCLPTCKKVFFVDFCFWWFCFLFLSVFVLCGLEKAPKTICSCSFRFFLFPQKACLSNFLCSSYSVSFLVLLLSSLSKISSFFFGFCPSTPFWKILFLGVSSVFHFFVAFSFVIVCLFLWNKLSWHLLCETQVAFWGVVFVCYSVVFFMFYVSAFLFFVFLCWPCFWYVYMLFLFCFCFASCFFFQTMKSIVFPCNSSVKLVTRLFFV